MKYLKVYIPTTVLTLLLVVVFMSFKPTAANALPASCSGSLGYGLAAFHGYFSCAAFDTKNLADFVIPGGVHVVSGPNVTYAQELASFESIIIGSLNGSSNSSTGAAFIIDTMLGVPAGTNDRSVSDLTITKWKTLVEAYGSGTARLINYNNLISWKCGTTDSAYDPINNDVFLYPVEHGGSINDCGSNATVSAITFSSPDGKVLYSIKTDCGNSIGTLQALPSPQTDTISGAVQVRNITTNTVTSLTGASVILTETGPTTSDTKTTTTNSGGRYSFSVPDGDHFTIAMSSSATPSGDAGPYTDYGGIATKYNCGPTTYQLQVAATPYSTPDNTGRSGTSRCNTIRSNDNYNFVYTGTSTTGCTINCGPILTCNTGSYDITPVVNPDTPYIGAGYPNSSISFSSTGNFESDSNNPYNDNLWQSVNQSSQLFVTGTNVTSSATWNLSTGSNVPVGTIPIQTTVGTYSVPYQVKIVSVVIDPTPSTHWAPVANPNPTKETPSPPPASSYTSKSINIAAPVYTTIQAPGNPTTGYYTKEDIMTTYTYTKTTSTPGPTTYTCPGGWTPAGNMCTRTLANGKPAKPILATPHPGAPIIITTLIATDTSHQYYYYITWVSTPNVDCPPPVSLKIGYQPYMRVYGGDAMAGSTFDPSLTTACTPISGQQANIVGWNYGTPNYSGAGTEFAGYALGAIDGFATSQRTSSAGAGLSFANTSNNSPSSGQFGGLFVKVSCASDFYGAKPINAPAPPSSNVGNIPSGSYYQNGSFTISGGTVGTSGTGGKHVAIYVNGNAYISGNITLGGTWNTIGDIPSFELIVQSGNIFIDSSVTRLDGLYVAQGGTIYDCSVNGAAASGSQFSNNCNNSLVVNGSFIGTQVDLMRTPASPNNTLYKSSDTPKSGGSLSASQSGYASEVFNYSPAVWLGLTGNNWLGTNSNITNLNNYNSITSLPPVL